MAQTEGITVLSRPRAGSQVGEVQATGLIDAPHHADWETNRDYEDYTRDMPYTKADKIDLAARHGAARLAAEAAETDKPN